MKYSTGFWKKRQVSCQILVTQNKERKGQLAFTHKTPDKVCATFPPKKSSLCGFFSDDILVTRYLDGRPVNAGLPFFAITFENENTMNMYR